MARPVFRPFSVSENRLRRLIFRPVSVRTFPRSGSLRVRLLRRSRSPRLRWSPAPSPPPHLYVCGETNTRPRRYHRRHGLGALHVDGGSLPRPRPIPALERSPPRPRRRQPPPRSTSPADRAVGSTPRAPAPPSLASWRSRDDGEVPTPPCRLRWRLNYFPRPSRIKCRPSPIRRHRSPAAAVPVRSASAPSVTSP